MRVTCAAISSRLRVRSAIEAANFREASASCEDCRVRIRPESAVPPVARETGERFDDVLNLLARDVVELHRDDELADRAGDGVVVLAQPDGGIVRAALNFAERREIVEHARDDGGQIAHLLFFERGDVAHGRLDGWNQERRGGQSAFHPLLDVPGERFHVVGEVAEVRARAAQPRRLDARENAEGAEDGNGAAEAGKGLLEQSGLLAHTAQPGVAVLGARAHPGAAVESAGRASEARVPCLPAMRSVSAASSEEICFTSPMNPVSRLPMVRKSRSVSCVQPVEIGNRLADDVRVCRALGGLCGGRAATGSVLCRPATGPTR